MKNLIFITVILLGSIATSNAQGFFQAHIGPAFPTGDFKDDNFYDSTDDVYGSGNAATGLNLGMKYYYPLETEGLSLVFGIDFFYNTLNKEIKDELEAYAYDAIDITYSKYINIPIMAGVNYSYPVSEQIAIFGEGSLGVNMLKVTKYEEIHEDGEFYEKFSPSLKLAFKIGTGLWIQDKYSVGLHYYGLGSHNCKSEFENLSGYKGEDTFDKSLGVGEFTLAFGIKF